MTLLSGEIAQVSAHTFPRNVPAPMHENQEQNNSLDDVVASTSFSSPRLAQILETNENSSLKKFRVSMVRKKVPKLSFWGQRGCDTLCTQQLFASRRRELQEPLNDISSHNHYRYYLVTKKDSIALSELLDDLTYRTFVPTAWWFKKWWVCSRGDFFARQNLQIRVRILTRSTNLQGKVQSDKAPTKNRACKSKKGHPSLPVELTFHSYNVRLSSWLKLKLASSSNSKDSRACTYEGAT
jgi:hypothetical protein